MVDTNPIGTIGGAEHIAESPNDLANRTMPATAIGLVAWIGADEARARQALEVEVRLPGGPRPSIVAACTRVLDPSAVEAAIRSSLDEGPSIIVDQPGAPTAIVMPGSGDYLAGAPWRAKDAVVATAGLTEPEQDLKDRAEAQAERFGDVPMAVAMVAQSDPVLGTPARTGVAIPDGTTPVAPVEVAPAKAAPKADAPKADKA